MKTLECLSLEDSRALCSCLSCSVSLLKEHEMCHVGCVNTQFGTANKIRSFLLSCWYSIFLAVTAKRDCLGAAAHELLLQRFLL